MTTQSIAMGGAVVLLLTVSAGFVRVLAGPTAADRMIAVQLFGTTGVGAALLLSRALGNESFVDLALVIALLATITTIAFVRQYWAPVPEEGDDVGGD